MPNDEIHPTNRSVRRVVPSGPLGALNASLKSRRDQEIGVASTKVVYESGLIDWAGVS